MSLANTTSSRERQAATEQREQGMCLPEDAARLTAQLTLRDGATITMRAIRADDTGRLRALHSRLSLDTIVLRFFRALPTLPQEMAERLTHVDYENRMALVATTGEGTADERMIAVVRYERIGPAVGEVAFVVEDGWQRRGIATLLLHRLAEYARGRGFEELVAITMGSNTRMLGVLRHCGFPATSSYADGEIEVRLDITQPPMPVYAQ